MQTSLDILSSAQLAPLTSGRDMWSTMPAPEVGMISVRMADGPMGIANGRLDERDTALLTPCPTALAATWNPATVQAIGGLVGRQARSKDIDVVLAPNVNLVRSPLAGRLFEMFSEDPLLTGSLAAAWTEGVQSNGVGTVVKHFVCNDSETARHSMNSIVDEKTLREVYLQPFEHCAWAGSWAMMTAYNRINGQWCSSAANLITGVVKTEWGFDGVVLSDWFGTHDGVANLSAGLDLEMPGPARHMGSALLPAIDAGRVEAGRLKDAATRLARLAQRVSDGREIASQPVVHPLELLTRATCESVVMLRNDGVLPLRADRDSLAVIGPNAWQPCLQGGSFARVSIDPSRPTPIEAIRDRFGLENVTASKGVAPDYRVPPMAKGQTSTPNGDQGVLVEILSEDGELLFSETRETSLLIWLAEMPGFGKLDKPGIVRVRTRFETFEAGTHRLYFGGTGRTFLSVDGHMLKERDPKIAPADIMGALLKGDSEHVDVSLEQGQALEIQYEMHFIAARAQGIWFGCRPPESPTMFEDALAVARAASRVVLIVGDSQDAALESVDRSTTALAAEHKRLVQAVCAENPHTIVVVNAARPVEMEWAGEAAAILQVWFPGQEFGPALAKILAGDEEPGGRLPVTIAVSEADYPAFDLTPDAAGAVVYREGCDIGYRSLLKSGIRARYPFGYGMGYARIELADVTQLLVHEPTFQVRLHNLDSRAGKAVAQLYFEPRTDTGELGAARLVGFASVLVEGHSENSITLRPDTLASRQWSEATKDWSALDCAGRYFVGMSCEDRRYTFEMN